ncbi:MAG: VOC family protein [Rhodanobacter sp.]
MAVAVAVSRIRLARLGHVRLCSAHAKPLVEFYESALGFREVAVEHLSGARSQERFEIAGRSLRITLELGAQKIKLVQFIDQPGDAYPFGSTSSDRVFQHFAIVVADMASAMAQLSRARGWTPITRDGPQRLPASSGGVTAFKFRDPEGHPLELLHFPPGNVPAHWQQRQAHGPFLGIDHSAICVGDSARSAAFYASLGLDRSQQSVNDDPAQARLDHLKDPTVEVTAMSPAQSTPHVELLCYRGTRGVKVLDLRANDVAATCLVFKPDKFGSNQETSRPPVQNLVDPDGHHLAIAWHEA